MPDEALMPCPFHVIAEAEDVSIGTSIAGLAQQVFYHVECTLCGAMGPSCDTKEQAVEAWNRRSPPPPSRGPASDLDPSVLENLDAIKDGIGTKEAMAVTMALHALEEIREHLRGPEPGEPSPTQDTGDGE